MPRALSAGAMILMFLFSSCGGLDYPGRGHAQRERDAERPCDDGVVRVGDEFDPCLLCVNPCAVGWIGNDRPTLPRRAVGAFDPISPSYNGGQGIALAIKHVKCIIVVNMANIKLTLSCLSEHFAICRLEADARLPSWAEAGDFTSITRTVDELSIVCGSRDVPAGIRCEKGYRCIKVEGPLDFALTGILASLTTVLAQASISAFAVSTFDTDYILVKEDQMEKAVQALSKEGHIFPH